MDKNLFYTTVLTCKASHEKEDDENPGPEATAAGVTAGVTLSTGRAVIRLLLPLLDWFLPQHGRVQTLSTLGQMLPGLELLREMIF